MQIFLKNKTEMEGLSKDYYEHYSKRILDYQEKKLSSDMDISKTKLTRLLTITTKLEEWDYFITK